MKKLLRILKNKSPNALPLLAYSFIRLLHVTLRLRLVNTEAPRTFHDAGKGTIQVMWHSRLGLGAFAYQGKGGHILISSHGDGEIIARITALFGFDHVRGSSSRGGEIALKKMLKLARCNEDLIITPDGPRGPAEVVKPGVAQIGKLTGLPVIPFAMSASSCIRLNSWDRFLIPLPFAKCFFVWGDPIFFNDGDDLETFRLRIEHGLRSVTAVADGLARQ